MVMQEMMEEPATEAVLDNNDEVIVDMSDVQEQLQATCDELKVSLAEHAEELKRGLVVVGNARPASISTPAKLFELESNAVVQDERTGLKF